MSFLTPLYLLAGLAVTLPILFHLIRRTPRGRQDFSSLMFLTPSPPRVTKRSRIEDWLLLVLRGLAVCLLAMAFSRPFFRAQADTSLADTEIRQWAILLDTSASMRREGFWEQARLKLDEVLQEMQPQDLASIALFDRTVRSLVTEEEWTGHPAGDRDGLVSSRLKDVQPSWMATSLATAVVGAAEGLDQRTDRQPAERIIVVISDMQTGSDWEGLRDYAWPETVSVRIEQIGAGRQRANATLQPVLGDDDSVLRLRISNAADSLKETFRVFGHSGTGSRQEPKVEDVFVDAETSVYVPPGQSRVVKAPEPPDSQPSAASIEARTAWIIQGDDEPFDNTCYVTPSEPWDVQVVYFGADQATDPQGLRFFLGPVFPSDARRVVAVRDADASRSIEENLSDATLAVVTGELNAAEIAGLNAWISKGGLVLFVATTADQGQQLFELAGSAPQPVEEASVSGYAMLTSPDFTHPVIAPYADPRYSDFTRLKIWKHRRLDLSTVTQARTLLKFDDDSTALAEIPVSQGRIYAFATGWNRDDSELALWSKFVPLMNGLLEYGGRQPNSRLQFFTGDSIYPEIQENGALRIVTSRQLEASAKQAASSDVKNEQRSDATKPVATSALVRGPDGQEAAISTEKPLQLDRPGIYAAGVNADELKSKPLLFAVNLAPGESRTEPLSKELLEAAGVKMQARQPEQVAATDALRERQLMNHELESRQQVWRWLLVAALVLILLESALSGRIARRRMQAMSS